MVSDIDFTTAIFLTGGIATSGLAVAGSTWTARRPGGFERLDGEPGLPLLGKAPFEAAYAVALPIGRGLAALGVRAHTVTVSSAFMAVAAAVFFATGHFGVGTAAASLAGVADVLDGIIARDAGTVSRFGQVLDTTVDRYVEALLVGGIAFRVRADGLLFVLALGALVGGFMVSYASSVLRELGTADRHAPMRRAHRLVYLLAGAAFVPFVQAALPDGSQRVQLAPVLAALVAIAVVGNVSAVRRLLTAAQPRHARDSARAGRARGAIDSVVVSERASTP